MSFPDGELDQAVELGAVDERGVRLWLRARGQPALTATLLVEGRPPVRGTVPLSAETDWTGALALALPEPAPGAAFTCTAGERTLSGRLAPAPGAPSRVVFGFGSCHLPFAVDRAVRLRLRQAAAIYPAMRADLLRREAQFLLLVGDQIYADALAPLDVRRLAGERGPLTPAGALAAYRLIARGFLGEAGVRRLRETFPTYCIWDDHEIIDSWGSRRSVSRDDRVLFAAASRAYVEYQHTRNPVGGLGPPPYHYAMQYGDVGVLVLDLRGARDYRRGQLLGAEQWRAVQTYLGGAANIVSTLFVVASVPIAHASRWLALLGERLPGGYGDAVRERWCATAFLRERDALLAALLAWQQGAPRRQVVILSGDVHCASAFCIRPRRGPGRLLQLTSSAFTTPDPWFQRLMNRFAVRLPNLAEPRYRFRGGLITLRNNFGTVSADPLPGGGHHLRLTIRAWDARRRLVTAAQIESNPRH